MNPPLKSLTTFAAAFALVAAISATAQPYGRGRATKAVAPASLLEASNQGVESQEKNVALYDRYLAAVNDYPDLTHVFTNLQRASRDAHLPAFKAAVASAGKLAAPTMQAQMGQCPQGHGQECCQKFCWPQAGRVEEPASK